MIKVEGLCRRYGNFTAVHDISFNIEKGQIVGLLGHNGAGKTTIMKMLTGFLEPGAGSIEIDGLKMPEQRGEIQAKIGYLPEHCPVYPEMTVIDYLEYAADLRGMNEQQNLAAVREAIARTELESKAADTINTLSRGFRQRVGVAQAILCKPEILILDEPTNGLDPTQIQHMRELITSLGQSATVILSTHILHEVQVICDRVLIIKDAELALDAKLDELQNSRVLSLTCNNPPDKLPDLLAEHPTVTNIQQQSTSKHMYSYRLEFDQSTNHNELAAAIIKALTNQGVDIYSLAPVQQDLESVFRQINSVNTDSTGDESYAA